MVRGSNNRKGFAFKEGKAGDTDDYGGGRRGADAKAQRATRKSPTPILNGFYTFLRSAKSCLWTFQQQEQVALSIVPINYSLVSALCWWEDK